MMQEFRDGIGHSFGFHRSVDFASIFRFLYEIRSFIISSYRFTSQFPASVLPRFHGEMAEWLKAQVC